MTFWSHPFLFPSQPFQSSVFTKDAIPSPTGLSAQQLKWSDKKTRAELENHLLLHFTKSCGHPELVLPFSSEDIVFYVKDRSDQIAGTVRYHPIGTFKRQPIHVVDAFCVHPIWRKRGIADYLLSELHRWANKEGIPYALFLKEGPMLPIRVLPIYSGKYVYRAITSRERHSAVTPLSIREAYHRMDIFLRFQDLFVIRKENHPNQKWFLYKKGIHYILACVQDTHQRWKDKTMGWVTAWMESPLITDEIREEASRILSDQMEFDYIWMNQLWAPGSIWIPDGTFHWYAYQWTTSLHIDRSYCLLF